MDQRIQVENLTKSFALLDKVSVKKMLKGQFEKIVTLKDISFTLADGEMLGVMGKNGEGKSTLLRVLAGVYGFDSGKLSVIGNFAAIFEMGTFMSMHHTGRQYCKEYLYYMAPPSIDVEALILEIVEFTELEEFFDRPIYTYSSGMQAKLLFAVATAIPTEVFLVDEVLVVGDGYFQGKAWRRLRSMLDEGTSGVIVTHDWQAVLKLCKKALLLKNHEIDYWGSALGMVRRYLGQNGKKVRSKDIFIPDDEAFLRQVIEGVSGEDFSFSFDICVKIPPKKGRLGIYFYFEYFKVGVGWKMLFLCEHIEALNTKGTYEVTVFIPNLPIAPGEYAGGLELVVPLEPGQVSFSKVYSRMNWLNESPLTLSVTGIDGSGKNTLLAGRVEWNN